jgi:arylsulfatase A-like enzyme
LQTNFRTTIPDAVTLPQYFRDQGYYAAAIGKIFHNSFPDHQSWSEPEMHIDGYPFDPDAVYRSRENLELLEQRKQDITAAGDQARYIDQYNHWYLKAKSFEIVDMPDHVYYDGAQTDVAIDKLAALSRMDKPFFFGIGYYRPHLPFNVPKKYWDLYDRATIPLADNDYLPSNAPAMAINNMKELAGYADFRKAKHPAEGRLSEAEARLLKHGYLASVSYVDAQIGRLIETLKRLNLYDNTIIVLWGDNGYKLGEHNSWCKMTDYEIDTRVPLIVSAPGVGTKKVACHGLVELVDIYPSLCELAGLKIPEGLEGSSFVPLLINPERAWKEAVFSQYLSEGRWAPPDGNSYMGYAIRTARYRYVEFYKWPGKEYVDCELYDRQVDPGENNNIAALPGNKELVARLSAQLKRGWKAALPK